mgnify:CR=1 FL=1
MHAILKTDLEVLCMKGIVITGHGPFAEGLLETSKLFFGEQTQMKACCLKAEDNPDVFVEVLKQAIREVDSGDGVIVLCDLLFGSPCNCMARIIAEDPENDSIEVVTGVNLAMILQALAARQEGNLTVKDLLEAGTDGVSDLKAVLQRTLKKQ